MDTGLPLGGRSSPGIFNYLPDAVEWIIKSVCGIPHQCHLSDFCLSAEPQLEHSFGVSLEFLCIILEKSPWNCL